MARSYRSMAFNNAIKCESGHVMTSVQIYDPRSQSTYVKGINRNGNEVIIDMVEIVPSSGGFCSGQPVELPWSNVASAIQLTDRDQDERRKHGKILTPQERGEFARLAAREAAGLAKEVSVPIQPPADRGLSVAFQTSVD